MTAHTSLFFSVLTAVFRYQTEPAETEQTRWRGKISWSQKVPVACTYPHTHTHTTHTKCICRFCSEADGCSGSNILQKVYELTLKQSRESNKNKGIRYRLRPKQRNTSTPPVTTAASVCCDYPELIVLECWQMKQISLFFHTCGT